MASRQTVPLLTIFATIPFMERAKIQEGAALYYLTFTFVEWLAGEHYLFFQLYREIWGTSEPVNSYLINIENKQVMSPPDWKGNCNVVAFSPRTGHMATWCLTSNEQDTSETYAVIEENGEQWFSNERPLQIVKEREASGEYWLWSHDRQYFVFSDIAAPRGLLNIMDTSTETIMRLADEYSVNYTVVALSPNNRYLAYYGRCPNGDSC